MLAELRRDARGIVEVREHLRVGTLLDLREHALGGWVCEHDRPIRGAHEHGFAHRVDDGVQLRGASVLRLGQALEPCLGLDTIGDVAGDGDEAVRATGELDPLHEHLDRDRIARSAEGEGHRPCVGAAGRGRSRQSAEVARVEVGQHRCQRGVDQRRGGDARRDRRPEVGVDDAHRLRVDDEHDVERRIEEAPEAVGVAVQAGVLDGARGAGREALGEVEIGLDVAAPGFAPTNVITPSVRPPARSGTDM